MTEVTETRRNLWLAIAGVALVQAAVLGWMIWERASLLASGREVVLEVFPVDPRSLFRGDYVVLNYAISNVDVPADAVKLRRGDDIYVTLQRAEDDKWQPVQTSLTRPTTARADQVVLKGRIGYVGMPSERGPGQMRVRYGIESFFVPEGAGRDLEKLVADRKLSALIAVDEEGNAGIKGLIADGKRVYKEPLI